MQRAEVEELRAKEKLLEAALHVAMGYHEPALPGDSRAIPDWFVACAAVMAKLNDDDGKIMGCLSEEMAKFPLPRQPAAPILVSYQDEDGRDHWQDDEDYPISDWKYEVSNGDTMLGYADWLGARREQEIDHQAYLSPSP